MQWEQLHQLDNYLAAITILAAEEAVDKKEQGRLQQLLLAQQGWAAEE
jgi:hypothetical protein